ncbi:hypothetical protein [Streptomyces sp. Ag109_G2-15]|uniref:hypothetical protein n=1 Tax=Streptomyces sp. Ag109_G2-15 TaxID=1938850 RepID=UPI000BCE4CFB|nr:hypothetical protein [Streptomyces sp. Ag109_G2-15]SOE06960.1 hypothetical protein SAMN06272765_7835 [Streptomyces sp. Ag109_G2-15]
MRWWALGCAVAAVVVLAGCGAPAGGGGAAGTGTSGSGSPAGASTSSSGAATPTSAPSVSAASCAAGHLQVTVSPGDRVRRLCVRPGAVVTLVLRARVDDKRWTGVVSSAPALVVPAGWQVDADGTAHATLRCAGTRGGAARVTVSAKAPDVAGAPRGVFTLDVNVVPYPQNG